MPNVGSLQRKRLYKCTRLLACFVPLFFMVLHHRTRRHLFGPISIATAFLRRVLDMFVHSLFFIANSAQRLLFFLFPWHNCTPFSTLSFKYEVTPNTFHTIARNKMSHSLFHIQPHVSSCTVTRDMYIPAAAHRKVETGPPLFSWTIPVRASMLIWTPNRRDMSSI